MKWLLNLNNKPPVDRDANKPPEDVGIDANISPDEAAVEPNKPPADRDASKPPEDEAVGADRPLLRSWLMDEGTNLQ